MPLVRLRVRNEYGLGRPELHGEADREDPKALLDGVAVAGLVGILRQLGDLAEFAAEVFHGLQEQVAATASRSHKLSARAKRIEAALPPLEKAILAQTSHIHFAYTAGSDWHTRIRNGKHHFIDNDLPRFIMDSYEECRDPPRLHLLDKFDTGGPGSCLRRYSDPTFFRRVSAGPDEKNVGKVRGDKKARKMKKRRSFPKNAELSRGAPMANHSDRMRYASPIANRKSSPTASIADSTIKSDIGDPRSTSDFRSGSGYIECIFRASDDMPPEEEESNRSSSSRVMLREETVDSVSPYEENQVIDTYSPQKTAEESIASKSDYVRWDEKTEIMEPREQKYEGMEDSATISMTLGVDAEEADKLRNVDVSDIDLCLNTNTSKARENQVDDVDSELDNFEDALNTIESESENDVDYQTKRELRQRSSSVDIEEIKVAVDELPSRALDGHPSHQESDTPSHLVSNEEVSLEVPKSDPTESCDNENTSQIPQKFADPDCLPPIKVCQSADLLDDTKVETFAGDVSSVIFAPPHNEVTDNICEGQESPSERTGVKFWTNGGLLGLEPAKPPDFATSNRECGMRTKDDQCEGKLDISTENADIIERDARSKCSTSRKINENSPFAERTHILPSSRDLDAKFSESDDLDKRCKYGHPNGDFSTPIRVVAPGRALPVAPTAKVPHSESIQENDDNLSGVFGLGHKLLMNSFRRKISLVSDEKPKPYDTTKDNVLEQSWRKHESSFHTTAGRNFIDQFQSVSPTYSLPPSPPLEHMKISFHPLHGFEASRLTLKFPHDKNRQESSNDMFPSFQLVPEPNVPFRDVCSDSDDGTFCRSSLYISDDCLSPHSESNSEQWESSETPRGSKEHDQFDALCRDSPTDSTSTSSNQKMCVNGEYESLPTEDGLEPLPSFSSYVHGPSLDLPSFDSMVSVPMQEENVGRDPENYTEKHYPHQPLPPTPPPPPPPVDWQLSKPYSDAAEVREEVSESLNHDPECNNLDQSIFKQPKQGSALETVTIKGPELLSGKLQDQPKLNPHEEANQAKVKETDEREDFLLQIRNKSFNLRRTETGKPTAATARTASGNVTAILEKANAIRQAVASEDGDENDSWSDT
ncbi:SCAR-like protein 2 isoform X1 [Syzygium oleosum]|uniref:SCAR-like protein 2 isoform X1 n=2 Tax=Syzygium oleosum TaxID=219896 RepID=UPI0024B9325B|nr:SCAR-like protein 2 isoform X1 [Syzygium oleosum]